MLAQIISQLIELQKKPDPFTPGEPLFWDDPHISKQMLEVHLNPNTDAASRKPETIDRSVNWLINVLDLKPGASILDLRCGPGLYASRLAQAGFHLTGVDYSRRSIEYATKYAKENNLQVNYRYQNYLELDDENLYDAAFLIYGDFCPLTPEQRKQLVDFGNQVRIWYSKKASTIPSNLFGSTSTPSSKRTGRFNGRTIHGIE